MPPTSWSPSPGSRVLPTPTSCPTRTRCCSRSCRPEMGSGVRKIILLTLGWEELPKSVSVLGAPPELRMREPVPGVLLQCDGGWLLLDTGFNTALVRDPALYRRYFPSVEYRPVLPGPGEPIEEGLAQVGIDIDEVYSVGVSH